MQEYNLERESSSLSEVITGFFPRTASCVFTCINNIKGNQGRKRQVQTTFPLLSLHTPHPKTKMPLMQ